MGATLSDPSLLSDVRKFGRFDTNACLQCGSCTLSCSLTGDFASFPRRTLRYALLGLRAPLHGSLDPWLCYYCGDCSTACPRDSEPGEGMMTLRRYLAAQYDWTGLTSKIYRSAAWEIGANVVVALLTLALIVLYHLYVVEATLSDLVDTEFAGSMSLDHMFGRITIFTRAVFLLALFFLLANAARMYWLTVRKGVSGRIPFRLYLTEAKTFVVHLLTQRRLRECTDRSRWYFHSLLVFGCLLMFVLLFFGLEWFQTDQIHPLYHPQRWLGYLATAAILVGIGELFVGRIRKRTQPHRFSDPTDWIFPLMLLLTVLTGIAIHFLRYMGLGAAAHYTYAAHLVVAVPLLLIEMPFGKWSHMIYRPLAGYFKAVREGALQQQPSADAVPSHAR